MISVGSLEVVHIAFEEEPTTMMVLAVNRNVESWSFSTNPMYTPMEIEETKLSLAVKLQNCTGWFSSCSETVASQKKPFDRAS